MLANESIVVVVVLTRAVSGSAYHSCCNLFRCTFALVIELRVARKNRMLRPIFGKRGVPVAGSRSDMLGVKIGARCVLACVAEPSPPVAAGCKMVKSSNHHVTPMATRTLVGQPTQRSSLEALGLREHKVCCWCIRPTPVYCTGVASFRAQLKFLNTPPMYHSDERPQWKVGARFYHARINALVAK